MKCILRFIKGDWYAENLGESSELNPYNFMSEGDLYKVVYDRPELLEGGEKVKVALLPIKPGEASCEGVEFTCRIVSPVREILNNTSPEVRDGTVKLDLAIEYVKKSQGTQYPMPYLLLGDIQEVIKILTGTEVPLENLTYKL